MRATELAKIITSYINSKGDTLTHKKLQKLLYYVDAWHMVYFEHPIIDEDFQAWVHGPVVPSVYNQYKEHGFREIELLNDEDTDVEALLNEAFENNGIDPDQQELVYKVLDQYGPLSAMELELLSHSEPPWKQTRNGLSPSTASTKAIDKDIVLEYFSSLIH